MFDMINIFEVFLPQLLRYPNAADPLNGDAASLHMRDIKAYEAKVKGENSPIDGYRMLTNNLNQKWSNGGRPLKPPMKPVQTTRRIAR